MAMEYDSLIHPWVCFSSFLPDISCSKESEVGTHNNSSNHSGMAISTVVPTLLEMTIQDPILLPSFPTILTSPPCQKHPLVLNNSLQLIGWVISGNHMNQCHYHKRLKSYGWDSGVRVPLHLTNQPGISGVAGVWKGKLIQFQPL